MSQDTAASASTPAEVTSVLLRLWAPQRNHTKTTAQSTKVTRSFTHSSHDLKNKSRVTCQHGCVSFNWASISPICRRKLLPFFTLLPLSRDGLTGPKANNAWTETGGGQTAKLCPRSSPQRLESALKDSRSGLFLSVPVESNRLDAGRPNQLKGEGGG